MRMACFIRSVITTLELAHETATTFGYCHELEVCTRNDSNWSGFPTYVFLYCLVLIIGSLSLLLLFTAYILLTTTSLRHAFLECTHHNEPSLILVSTSCRGMLQKLLKTLELFDMFMLEIGSVYCCAVVIWQQDKKNENCVLIS